MCRAELATCAILKAWEAKRPWLAALDDHTWADAEIERESREKAADVRGRDINELIANISPHVCRIIDEKIANARAPLLGCHLRSKTVASLRDHVEHACDIELDDKESLAALGAELLRAVACPSIERSARNIRAVRDTRLAEVGADRTAPVRCQGQPARGAPASFERLDLGLVAEARF